MKSVHFTKSPPVAGSPTQRIQIMARSYRVWTVWLEAQRNAPTGSCWSGKPTTWSSDLMLVSQPREHLSVCLFKVNFHCILFLVSLQIHLLSCFVLTWFAGIGCYIPSADEQIILNYNKYWIKWDQSQSQIQLNYYTDYVFHRLSINYQSLRSIFCLLFRGKQLVCAKCTDFLVLLVGLHSTVAHL